MESSDLDNLRTSRRAQARKTAQKLRLQPIDYVEKSVVIQNEGTKNKMLRTIELIDKDLSFRTTKMDTARKQFVSDQRRLLKPAFDGKVTLPDGETSKVESAFPDLDSDFLRVVEYYEIHKPNAVKRIHTVKHLEPAESSKWRSKEEKKGETEKLAKNKLGSNLGSSKKAAKHLVPHTHRGDMTDKERNHLYSQPQESNSGPATGFYLSTGAKTPDINSSMGSSKSSKAQFQFALNESLNETQDADTDDEVNQANHVDAPQLGKHLVVPVQIVPPIPSIRHTPEQRFQSPPSTKKFRHYKVRTSVSDRGKVCLTSREGSQNVSPVPRQTKSNTPFTNRRHRLPIHSADMFNSPDDDFKNALTESNLKLHVLRNKQKKTPQRTDAKYGGFMTPSLAGSMENLTVEETEHQFTRSRRSSISDVNNDDTHHLMTSHNARRRRPTQQTGYGVGDESHTKAVHETILEVPRKSKVKLFKSKRYGDSYLVRSDVSRTCQDIPFDPYVLALEKKEIDEIETRKRLKDIDSKLKAERQREQFVQSNVNDWVKKVDKQAKEKRLSQALKSTF